MCILCGINHTKGAPCDFRGADSLLLGRINIQPSEPELEEPLSFETTPVQILEKKKGRPFGKHHRS